MTSYPTRHFTSSHETDQPSSWTKGHSIEGQETLVVDSSYGLYDPIPTQPADHSSTSSLSSMASLFSNTIEPETDIIEASRPQTKPKLQQRSLQRPLFENTSDWDTPSHPETSISNPPRSFWWSESIQVLLKCILWLSFFSWVYKVYSCIDLKQMPTERLYAVDPGAPINVWIPVSVTFVPLKIKYSSGLAGNKGGLESIPHQQYGSLGQRLASIGCIGNVGDLCFLSPLLALKSTHNDKVFVSQDGSGLNHVMPAPTTLSFWIKSCYHLW